MSSCSGSGYLLNRISSFRVPQSRELLGFGSLASRYSVRFLAPFRSGLGLAFSAGLGGGYWRIFMGPFLEKVLVV